MEKFISLIIFSLIFKGYIGECTDEGQTSVDGKICVLKGGKYEEIDQSTLCENKNPSGEADCTSAPTVDDSKYKCLFQAKDASVSGSKDECKQKELCAKIATVTEEKSCTNAPTTNTVTLKCVYKEEGTTKKCVEEEKKCTEITAGGTDAICSKAGVSDDKKKCVADNGKCKEVENDATSSSKNSTKSSTKSEEKNGAKYVSLSFGLLSLLFL